MGVKQDRFLAEFRSAFGEYFDVDGAWLGGQAAENCAAFLTPYPCRREVGVLAMERFELGDISITHGGWKVIVEFESKEVPLSNLLKYWPYLKGELNSRPQHPILICHFSDWWSYATRRDLWEWTLSQMHADTNKLVAVQGRQFDHGGADMALRASSITSAIAWIDSVIRVG